MKKLIIWLLLLVTSFTADAQLIGGGPRKPKGSGSSVDLSGYAVKAANNLFTGSNTFSGTVDYNGAWSDYQSTYGLTNQGGRIRLLRGSDGLSGLNIQMAAATSVTAQLLASSNLDIISSGGSFNVTNNAASGVLYLGATGTTAGQVRIQTGATESGRVFTNGNWRFGSSGVDNGAKVQVEGAVYIDGTLTIKDGTLTKTISGDWNFGNSVIRTGSSIIVQGTISTFGGGSSEPSALITSNSTTKGFLPPRMTAAQRGAISSPATGLMVYQTDAPEGVFVNTSTGWKQLAFVP